MLSWWCWYLLRLMITVSKVDEDEDGLISLLEWIGDQGGLINNKRLSSMLLTQATTKGLWLPLKIFHKMKPSWLAILLDAILAAHQSDNPTTCVTQHGHLLTNTTVSMKMDHWC